MSRSRTGKKGPYAAYYVHFQPGSCFVGRSPFPLLVILSSCLFFSPSFSLVCSLFPYAADVDARGIGGGLWHPEADPLALLREDIDENSQRWKNVLGEPKLRREFLNGASDDDKAIVDAFAHRNRDSALKTKPKVCSMLSILLSARNQPPSCPTVCPSGYHCARSDRQHSMLFVMEGPGGLLVSRSRSSTSSITRLDHPLMLEFISIRPWRAISMQPGRCLDENATIKFGCWRGGCDPDPEPERDLRQISIWTPETTKPRGTRSKHS